AEHHEVAGHLVATLTRETSGNPFFIRAVLLHLLEQGALVRDGGRWRVAGSLERLGLPETVRQVIERRLGRMSEGARDCATSKQAVSRPGRPARGPGPAAWARAACSRPSGHDRSRHGTACASCHEEFRFSPRALPEACAKPL